MRLEIAFQKCVEAGLARLLRVGVPSSATRSRFGRHANRAVPDAGLDCSGQFQSLAAKTNVASVLTIAPGVAFGQLVQRGPKSIAPGHLAGLESLC